MKVVVLGGGESGTGAALLAQQQGHEVFLSESEALAPRFRETLEAHGIPYEEGRHTMDRLLQGDVIVKSPGISGDAPVVLALRGAGKQVIGEIEWAARHAGHSRIIGITGSNGKTTTTLLLGHLLRKAGKSVALGGNLGRSFSRTLLTEPAACYVLELSSFQLDDIVAFRPHVAAILNITPDHLDRYGGQMERYVAAKFRIAMNQQAGDLLIVNAEDVRIRAWLAAHPLSVEVVEMPVPPYPADVLEVAGHRFDMRRTELRGPHNYFNAAVAVAIALGEGAEAAALQAGLESFRNAPHRLEVVARKGGVVWINDSKATNVDAVRYALQATPGPLIWIAGGIDKGNDYGPLEALVARSVKALICLGRYNEALRATFGPVVGDVVEARNMREAVEAAARRARAGDTVLLSPACASFDLFDNYEDRGEQFRAEVQRLVAEE